MASIFQDTQTKMDIYKLALLRNTTITISKNSEG